MKRKMESLRMLKHPASYIGWILVFVFLVIGIYFWTGYITGDIPSTAMDIMLFIGIALSLAIIMSYTGYVSFGHVVFFGIGGFFMVLTFDLVKRGTLGFLQGHGILTFIVGTLFGIGVAVALAASVGAAVLRLRGAFFAIATIGLDYAILYLEVLYGEGGEVYINPGYHLFNEKTYAMYLIGFIITFIVAYLVRVSKFGYGLAAIREDEDAAEILGVNTTLYKTYAFIIAAALAAMWGALFSWRTSSFTSENFSLAYSVDMIVMNVIGGLGTFSGPIIGAIIYYYVKRLTLIYVPQLALVVMGAIVVVVVSFFPEGLVGIIKKYYKKFRDYLI